MSPVRTAKILICVILTLFAAAFITPAFRASYVPTGRDTLPPPEKLTAVLHNLDDYQLLYETEKLAFYYYGKRGIIAVSDKRLGGGFHWKTGLDIPFNQDVDTMVSGLTRDEKEALGIAKEDRMSAPFIGIANSLLCVEYYDRTTTLTTLGSASQRGSSFRLLSVEGEPSRYVFSADFSEANVQVDMEIYFNETGMEFHIPDANIKGEGQDRLAGILLAPYLGAGGGRKLLYDKETDGFDIRENNPMPPAYALLPDGSGSLVRFMENTASLSQYKGMVYGWDISMGYQHAYAPPLTIPPKNPLMPLFGIAYGQDQYAFIAHAKSGAEYMEIYMRPSGNMSFYNIVYPRFVVNQVYFQVYNQRGSGYETLHTGRSRFDLEMRYEFLAGSAGVDDKNYAANYVGMARYYRDYLLETGQLKHFDTGREEIPLHIDFLMADAKKNLMGISDVVVTDVHDVNDIISVLANKGINNINASLLGFKKGGLTAAKIHRNEYAAAIGTKRDFENLVRRNLSSGTDISFAQDYALINEYKVSYLNNAVKHACGWYIENYLLYNPHIPVTSTSLLRMDKAVEYLRNFAKTADYCESITIGGLSNNLYGQFNNIRYTVTDSIREARKAFADINENFTINACRPYQYLWAYTGRFLDTPMFSTQFLIETDTVPFLQMVLKGSMELYSPYVNFSFYTERDILRMIDYNVYPAFLFTREPSYHLAQTNSSDMFSTEFIQYEGLLHEVYETINGALKEVMRSKWLNREVITPGVILNSYENGLRIVINYTNDDFDFEGNTVSALQAKVIR